MLLFWLAFRGRGTLPSFEWIRSFVAIVVANLASFAVGELLNFTAGSGYSNSMKKLLVLLFSITCFGTSVFGQVKYSTYHNSRFFFSIDYPSSLVIMQDPPANNDGRTFLSKDGRVEMRAWGQYNAQFLTVEEQFAEELNGHELEAITYKTLSKNWFVITGVVMEGLLSEDPVSPIQRNRCFLHFHDRISGV